MSEPLAIWSEDYRDGHPGGILHWGRIGEDMLCGRETGHLTDFEDMQAAVRSGREVFHDVCVCARCGSLYPDA